MNTSTTTLGQLNKIKTGHNLPLNLTFLVLDDLESYRVAGIKALKNLHFSGPFLEAEDVTGAKKIILEKKVDFILSDWNLPDGTGLEFLKFVRAQSHYKKVPFLMITTENEITNVLTAIGEGASNYLVKPWDDKGFLEAITSSWDKEHS
jgi:two-component system, chemotaxis family, chemotaxis protein CheY